MDLCLVTPRLPPRIDGVGDYSARLWKHWPDGDRWRFLVFEGAAESEKVFAGAKVENVPKSTEPFLAALNGEKNLVLQYSPYGYAPNGAGFWLVDALQKWKRKHSDAKLAVMFHEAWAHGMPWQRVFWQSAAQRKCVNDLLNITDVAVTSNEGIKRRLDSLNTGKTISLIPLGSSFDLEPPKEKNFKHLLAFGQEGTRLYGLQRHEKLIKAMAERGLIKRIVIAGKKSSDQDPSETLVRSWNLPIEVMTAYNFSPQQIPSEVTECGLALVHAQSTFLLKSSVFQFLAQAGTVAITWREEPAGAPVVEGQHYLAYKAGDNSKILEELGDAGKLEQISNNVRGLSKTSFSWETITRRWKDALDGR